MNSLQTNTQSVANETRRECKPHRAHAPRITPRLLGPARTPYAPMLLALAAAAGLTLAGCATKLQVPRVTQDQGVLHSARFAESSPGAPATQRIDRASPNSLAFLPPTTERDLDGVDPSAFTEFARNDARNALAGSAIILATNQWPTPEPPSLERQRRIFVGSQNTFLFFLPDDNFRHRTYWHASYRSYWR